MFLWQRILFVKQDGSGSVRITDVVDSSYSVGLHRVKDSLIQEYDQIVSELQQQIQLYKVVSLQYS